MSQILGKDKKIASQRTNVVREINFFVFNDVGEIFSWAWLLLNQISLVES